MEKKKTKMAIGLIVVIVLVAIGGSIAGSFLPFIGAIDTPANSYVSNYYITHAEEDTNSPNIVTAVLADYRGFDTLFETCVMFLSGTVALTALFDKEKAKKKRIKPVYESSYGGLVLDASFRLVIPFLMIYGIYVLAHGEVSLGGGFQAGALLACAYLLDRIMPSFQNRFGLMREETALILAGIGTFIYAFTGMLSMFNGGNFLEYGMLPFGNIGGGAAEEVIRELHSTGILMIEVGVTVCVMSVIINILEVVLERTEFDD